MSNEQMIDAIHVEQTIHESTLHYSHSMPTVINRIIVDLSNPAGEGPFLVIYFWHGEMGAFMIDTGPEYSRLQFRKIRDIKIPADLFYTAMELNAIRQKAKEKSLEKTFTDLTTL